MTENMSVVVHKDTKLLLLPDAVVAYKPAVLQLVLQTIRGLWVPSQPRAELLQVPQADLAFPAVIEILVI